MKPKLMHQQAMEFSFKAKLALQEGNYTLSFELYNQAANLESMVAEFYFDKPELEPTRSVVVRSAAFLNLKAGLVEKAQKFIFFGLLNTKDELIKKQLDNALELTVSLKNLTAEKASEEYNYLNLLRQRSIHYILEPNSSIFGKSVGLEMVRDFSDSYLKSLKAYAITKFKQVLEISSNVDNSINPEIEKLINPLITSSAYGSFKFSIANDFMYREGENQSVTELKSNIIVKYHNDIFTNPLTDSDIENFKNNYSEDEVNDIFRPLTKIKSNDTPYKVGYYDAETFNKKFVDKIVNKQRRKLLSVKQISQEDIGELESSIIHKRNTEGGKITKTTIFKEHLKSLEFEIKTNLIEPKDKNPLLLNEEIIVNVNFNSQSGFKFSFNDFQIEHTYIKYEKGLTDFYTSFYNKIYYLKNIVDKTEQELKDWEVVRKIIGNIDALK